LSISGSKPNSKSGNSFIHSYQHLQNQTTKLESVLAPISPNFSSKIAKINSIPGNGAKNLLPCAK
ncbi:hypothetical protein NP118_23440, partial [Salmonella enterica]|nr:hypothetical protein [Salmonella enterica]